MEHLLKACLRLAYDISIVGAEDFSEDEAKEILATNFIY